MKKVLVTSRSFGSISDVPKQILEDAGFEITFKGKDLKLEEFEAIIPAYDALIIGAHPFRPEVMERCPNLKLICKHGAGLDKEGWLDIVRRTVPPKTVAVNEKAFELGFAAREENL